MSCTPCVLGCDQKGRKSMKPSSFHPKTFVAIEGLRGILAWGVVLSHLTYMSAFKLKGVSAIFREIGLPSVLVFVIVSGFVITHVILQRQESYWPYITRRFFRIFPLFAVTCVIGFITSGLLAEASNNPHDFGFTQIAKDIAWSDKAHLPMHALAHLFMMHGAVPDDVLLHSEYAFNVPAWSISLEWQFYLVAPLFIFVLLKQPRWVIPLAIVVAAAEMIAPKLGLRTAQPGALPFAAIYFAAGIFSRLVYSEQFKSPLALLFATALAIVFFPVQMLRPFLVWMIVFVGLSNSNDGSALARLYTRLLKSPLALYFGSRSYSIYLCHYPVISVVVWLLYQWSLPSNMLVLTAVSVPLIIVTAQLAYRWIEQPGIAAGRRLAERHRPLTGNEVVAALDVAGDDANVVMQPPRDVGPAHDDPERVIRQRVRGCRHSG
jgi:peptidoglycan/LPS O-acetylase OafA/YrhL